MSRLILKVFLNLTPVLESIYIIATFVYIYMYVMKILTESTQNQPVTYAWDATCKSILLYGLTCILFITKAAWRHYDDVMFFCCLLSGSGYQSPLINSRAIKQQYFKWYWHGLIVEWYNVMYIIPLHYRTKSISIKILSFDWLRGWM